MKFLVLILLLFVCSLFAQSCDTLGERGCIASLKAKECQWCGNTNSPQCITYKDQPCVFPKKQATVRYAPSKALNSSYELATCKGDLSCLYVEGNHYFPLESLNQEAWNALTLTHEAYHCPWKGECLYWNFTWGGITHTEAAWTYWAPFPAATPIRNYIGWSPAIFSVTPTN